MQHVLIWIYFVCNKLWLNWEANPKTMHLFDNFFVKHRQAYKYHDLTLARSFDQVTVNVFFFKENAACVELLCIAYRSLGVYFEVCILSCVMKGVYSMVCILKCVSLGVYSEMCILRCEFWGVYSEVCIHNCMAAADSAVVLF